MVTAADCLEELRRIRMDLTNAQAKLTTVLEFVASLPTEPAHICPICETRQRGPLSLAEHGYHAHNWPVPAHWLEAERRAGFSHEELAEAGFNGRALAPKPAPPRNAGLA